MNRPGRPWNSTYWDALRYYYWSLRYVGLRGVPAKSLVREGEWVKVPARHLDGATGGLYVRIRKARALEAELHRDEVTLNQVLSTTLAIAADAVIERLLAAPLGITDGGPFERIGDGSAQRLGWGADENVTQPDGFYVGPKSVIALEVKLGAATSVDQIVKYAALVAWEEILHGPGKALGLLYIVPSAQVAGHWRRAGLTGPDDVPGLIDRLPGPEKLPQRLRMLVEEHPDHLRDVLARLHPKVISWSDLHAEVGALRMNLGTSMGDETLDRLLAGLAAQIEAHDGTEVGG